MIQNGTVLKVIDNSGAKVVTCIKILVGFKKRYAYSGDIIVVSINSLRSKRRFNAKVKKGQVYRALIVRTKTSKFSFVGDYTTFLENSVLLLSKQNKLIGTRVFGSLQCNFRFTKFLKILSLSSGNIL